MKPVPLLLLASCLAVLPARAQTEPTVLASENFETLPPESERVAEYPPADGRHRAFAAGRVSGWAGAGVVRLSHLPGVGTDGGAGLLVTPAEGADDTVYYLASFGPLPFAGRTGTTLRAGDVWALDLSFAVRAPVGRALNVSINLIGPKELEAETWASRLRLPPVVGTGAFARVRITGDQFTDEEIQAFLATARQLGDRRLRLAVQWYVAEPATWPPGESFALDDLELRFTR